MAFREKWKSGVGWSLLWGLPPAFGFAVFQSETPEIQFWVSVSFAAVLTTYVLGLILGFMGLTLTEWPKLIVASVIVLASSALFLTALDSAKQAKEAFEMNENVMGLQKGQKGLRSGQEQLRDKLTSLTGEASWAHLHSRGGEKRDGKFLLKLRGFGAINGVNIGLHKFDENESEKNVCWHQIMCWFSTNIRSVDANFPFSLGPGVWSIHYRSAHTNWDQILVLDESEDKLTVVTTLQRLGGGPEIDCCKTAHLTIKEVESGTR